MADLPFAKGHGLGNDYLVVEAADLPAGISAPLVRATCDRHRGADQAGAVFIVTRSRDGQLTLYGPAPQASYDDALPGERAFMIVLEDADQDALDVRLAREGRFDPDYWVVEIEAGAAPVGELIPLVTTP